MYCNQCGTEIPDKSNFCAQCGKPVGALPHTEPLPAQRAEPIGVPQEYAKDLQKPHDHTNKKKQKIYILSACAVVLIVVILFAVIGLINAGKYADAVALMDAQENAQAKEAFIALGGYKDSADLAVTCQNQLDYDTAKALMDAGKYGAAKQGFEALNDYGQAALMAVECQNIMDYTDAVALMDGNRYEEALDAFRKLGAYKDSAGMAADCQNKLDYDHAAAMMDRGEYDLAAEIFLALGEYSDSAARAEECGNAMTYKLAVASYERGQYYLAYILFTGLGGYLDSAACAPMCIQTNPDTGELYRNPDFGSKRCSLTIKTGDDGNSTFMKIYTEDGTLVSTAFIASGEKIRIKLPTGTYRMKAAYGQNWFGPEYVFGDDGYYELILFGNNAEVTSFDSKHVYTLSLKMVGAEGNLGARQENLEGF